MNKFEFKNLVKNLKDSIKEKNFFKSLRKEVETGANGTQDYVVKKGINKNTIWMSCSCKNCCKSLKVSININFYFT